MPSAVSCSQPSTSPSTSPRSISPSPKRRPRLPATKPPNEPSARELGAGTSLRPSGTTSSRSVASLSSLTKPPWYGIRSANSSISQEFPQRPSFQPTEEEERESERPARHR